MAREVHFKRAVDGPRDRLWIGYCVDSDTGENHDMTVPADLAVAMDEAESMVMSDADSDDVVIAKRQLAEAEKVKAARRQVEAEAAKAEADLKAARSRLGR